MTGEYSLMAILNEKLAEVVRSLKLENLYVLELATGYYLEKVVWCYLRHLGTIYDFPATNLSDVS